MTTGVAADDVPSDPALLRELCERLAVSAGRLAYTGRKDNAGRMAGETKTSATDLVTRYDRQAEAHVVAELRLARPDDAIIGEEGASVPGTSGYSWLIDPIDGTTNFVYDQPAWACSIAVELDGTVVAGSVYVPPSDELFSAATGCGATRDGRPISVTDTSDLAVALVGTGFSYQPEVRRRQAETVARLIGSVRDIRRLGSAAVDACMVACGRLDAYYEAGLNPWDSAAGELIAREAGAWSSDFSGGPARPDELVIATPGVHDGLIRLLSGG